MSPRIFAVAVLAVLLWLASATGVTARMFFVPADAVPIVGRPEHVLIEDLDGDGRDDLVVVSTRDTVAVLYGSTTSRSLFETPVLFTFGKRLRGAAAGDVTGDALVDLVVADERQRAVHILNGRAGRRFDAPRAIYAVVRAHTVAVADLDGRAGADLIIGERRSGALQIRYSQGPLSFTTGPRLAVPSGLAHVVSRDLDGDGLPELIAVSAGRGSGLSVLPARMDRDIIEHGTAGSVPVSGRHAELAVADFDGNSTLDLALLIGGRGGNDSQVAVTTTDDFANLDSVERVDVPCPNQGRYRFCRARGLAAADYDGDGIVDLATGLPNRSSHGSLGTLRAGLVSFLRGRGDTFVAGDIAPWLDRAPDFLASGDFDGDGRPDIVAINRTGRTLQAMRNLSWP